MVSDKDGDDKDKLSALVAKALIWMLTTYMVIAMISLIFPSTNQPEASLITMVGRPSDIIMSLYNMRQNINFSFHVLHYLRLFDTCPGTNSSTKCWPKAK